MRLRISLCVLALAALAAAPSARASSLPPIKHVFVVILENKSFDETFGPGSAAPILSQTLPSMGALLPNYYGVTHQSLGNYIALVSGQGSNPLTQADCQVYMDMVPGTIGADGQALGAGCVYPTPVKTIADQLTAGGLTWKGYMEDMGNAAGQPTTCRHPTTLTPDTTQSARNGDQYAARHNPFVYFHSLLDSGACAQDDVPLTQLQDDLASEATTPSYAFITPNLCDDGHDASCADGRTGGLSAVNGFLSTWVPRIMASRAYRDSGLLAILFDEADGTDTSSCCNEPQFPNTLANGLYPGGMGGGRTGAVLLSPYIDPGTIDLQPYNHFTMLRSTEDLFGLDHLGYAGRPGLSSLGADAFTCYAPATPRPLRGRLPGGSEIKRAVIGHGTPRPIAEVKLWHPGTVSIQTFRAGRHPGRGRAAGRPASLTPCELLKVMLPYRHGRAVLSARAFGGAERRTITF